MNGKKTKREGGRVKSVKVCKLVEDTGLKRSKGQMVIRLEEGNSSSDGAESESEDSSRYSSSG